VESPHQDCGKQAAVSLAVLDGELGCALRRGGVHHQLVEQQRLRLWQCRLPTGACLPTLDSDQLPHLLKVVGNNCQAAVPYACLCLGLLCSELHAPSWQAAQAALWMQRLMPAHCTELPAAAHSQELLLCWHLQTCQRV
jgi:hypothetical protein